MKRVMTLTGKTIILNRSIGILVMLLFVIVYHCFSQAHVQTRTLFQNTTATTISRAFAAASTTGNLIVVHLDWDNQARSISSVTDNKGNTYTRINGPTNWDGVNYRAELWYAYNITGGGVAINVTATLSGAPTSFFQIYISEYSGIVTTNPLDKNSVAIGNTAAVSSGSQTTTYTNELIYGAGIGASGAITVGAGFTSRSTANQNIIEDKNVAATGSYNSIFTCAGGNWVAQMATFISTTSLPIELLTFAGKCNNNNIVLEWSTASEINNDYFTIERSENGTNWQVIGTVKGAGNSCTIQKYLYTIDEINNEISYFRLKQTDFNGDFAYSQLIVVNNCIKDLMELNIYPNPSNGKFSLLFDAEKEQVHSILISNVFGQVVYYSDSYKSIIDLSDKQNGLYIVNINLNSNIVIRKVMIRK